MASSTVRANQASRSLIAGSIHQGPKLWNSDLVGPGRKDHFERHAG